MVLGQYGVVRVDTWWYWVSMKRDWLIHDNTGSVEGALVSIWWCWVKMGRYWLVFDGNGSVWGDTGCNLVVLGQYNLILIGIEW